VTIKTYNIYFEKEYQIKMEVKARTTLEEHEKGAFKRKDAVFRNWISEDSDRFKPESGRYHLYISYGCPWAHRTLIVRNLKGLQDHVGLSIVHPTWRKTRPEKDDHFGWVFANPGDAPLTNSEGMGSFECEDVIPDNINNCKSVRELYELSNDTDGKYSVPVLWDKKEKVIVNNESSDIVRMLNTAFNKLSSRPDIDLYPEALRRKIDQINDQLYHNVNNGVYKTGFAKTQEAYNEAVTNLFNTLDIFEDILSKSRYVNGDELTETDIRLFVTLIRFDEAYHGNFKCNKKMIADYPNLLSHTRELYQNPIIRETVNMRHIKLVYYTSLPVLNHFAIVPAGPNFIGKLQERHNRDEIGQPSKYL